ncbi:hypothetical protein D3C74_362170 [compost metagenome]
MNEKNKLTQLLADSEKGTGNQFALKIKQGDSVLIGSAPKPVVPTSAILLLNQGDSCLVKGYIDQVYSEISSNSVPSLDTIIVGVDCKKDDNNKIYYNLGHGEKKITSKTDMSKDEMFLLYWETEYLGCLTFCSYDDVRNEVIREVLSAKDEAMKRLLRGITSKFLSLLVTKIDSIGYLDTSETVYLDNIEEELSYDN